MSFYTALFLFAVKPVEAKFGKGRNTEGLV